MFQKKVQIGSEFYSVQNDWLPRTAENRSIQQQFDRIQFKFELHETLEIQIPGKHRILKLFATCS